MATIGLLVSVRENGGEPACYDIIKSTRRPIPEGTTREADGRLMLPTGETVAAADVDESGDVPTIPSEFADGVDV